MNSVFEEIEKLREDNFRHPTETLSSRYAVQYQELYGVKTAYCFSVPIRNKKNHSIVDLQFCHNKRATVFNGSEANIIITDRIRMTNQHGQCEILFQGEMRKKTSNAVYFTNSKKLVEIRPTLNGMLLIFSCSASSDPPRILLHLDRSFESIRSNNRYFSIMREKFTPFVTVSCIGAINDSKKITAPCEVSIQQLNDFDYHLTFCPTDKSNNRIAVEINMQEVKLFQDTTVESKNPAINNAFGGISFLGTSKAFGEQWLYSRLEASNIAQLQNKKIIKTILHIPQLGCHTSPITVNRIAERFCSFRSNWENKIAIKDTVALSSYSNGYYHLDITKLLGHLRKQSENFVIRGTSTSKPAIISTGDSFFAPQILEVTYQ